MPRTKKKPDPQTEPPSAIVNGTPAEVLTLAEAAGYLRLPDQEVIRLIHSQGLPARYTGSEWRFLKTAIQQWLNTGSPTPQTRKQAQLALAGKYKDDPDLLRICQEAYERRRQSIREDE